MYPTLCSFVVPSIYRNAILQTDPREAYAIAIKVHHISNANYTPPTRLLLRPVEIGLPARPRVRALLRPRRVLGGFDVALRIRRVRRAGACVLVRVGDLGHLHVHVLRERAAVVQCVVREGAPRPAAPLDEHDNACAEDGVEDVLGAGVVEEDGWLVRYRGEGGGGEAYIAK